MRARQAAQDALERQAEGLGLLKEGGLEVVDSLRQAWSDWAEDGRLDVDRLVDHMKARFAELLAERLIFGPLEKLIRGKGAGRRWRFARRHSRDRHDAGERARLGVSRGRRRRPHAASARLVPLGPNERLVIP